MSVLRALLLFAVTATAEIGGAWLVWQGIREHRGVAWIGAGIAALAAYGFVATCRTTLTSGASSPPTAGSSSPDRSPGASSPTASGPTATT
jgi:hypothetical protein